MTAPAAAEVFRGVAVALVTAFRDDGTLWAEASAELAVELVDRGIQAVVVAGTTGEARSLTADERVSLLVAVASAVGRRVPVVAGTGAATDTEAVALTRAAQDAGAAAVLALSPPDATADDVRRYYESLAAAATVPVLAYHFPRVSPPGIPAELLADLPVAGVKDSSGDADRLATELRAASPAVYVGSAVLVALAGELGAAGAVLAAANAEPEACVAAFAGDWDAQRSLLDLHHASRTAGLPALKAAVRARFGTPDAVRD